MENLQDRLRSMPTPEWLLKMQQRYAETGTYRHEDLRRLLGDQNRRVEVGPNASLFTVAVQTLPQ